MGGCLRGKQWVQGPGHVASIEMVPALSTLPLSLLRTAAAQRHAVRTFLHALVVLLASGSFVPDVLAVTDALGSAPLRARYASHRRGLLRMNTSFSFLPNSSPTDHLT